MVIKIVDSVFDGLNVGVSLPSGWLGDLELNNVSITGGDKGVEIRDPYGVPIQNVPKEILQQVILALDEIKQNNPSDSEAKAAVAAKPPVKSFLMEHGYTLANLGIGTGQLITAIIALNA